MDGRLDSFRAPFEGVVHRLSVRFQNVEPVGVNDPADLFQNVVDGLLVGEAFVQGLHDADDGLVRVPHLIEEGPVLMLLVDIHEGVGAVVRDGGWRNGEVQPKLRLRAEDGGVDFFAQNCGPITIGEPVRTG